MTNVKTARQNRQSRQSRQSRQNGVNGILIASGMMALAVAFTVLAVAAQNVL